MYKCITFFLIIVPLLVGQNKLDIEVYFENGDVITINNFSELIWEHGTSAQRTYLYKSEWSPSELENQRIILISDKKYSIPPDRIKELEFYDYHVDLEEGASGTVHVYAVKFIIEGRTGRIEKIGESIGRGFSISQLKVPDIDRGELDFDYEEPKAQKVTVDLIWSSSFEGGVIYKELKESSYDSRAERIVLHWR